MAFQIVCPWCKTSLTFDDSQRGKQAACRHCQKPMRLPGGPVVKPSLSAADGVSQSITAEAKSSPVAAQRQPRPGTTAAKQNSSRPRQAAKLPGPRVGGIPVVLIAGAGLLSLLVLVAIGAVALLAFKSAGTQCAHHRSRG